MLISSSSSLKIRSRWEEWEISFSQKRDSSLKKNILLSRYTWFQVGGPADFLFRPESREDLCQFLKGKPMDMPVTLLGAGSNVLVSDQGIEGTVIRLGGEFTHIRREEGGLVIVGAGALDRTVALTTAEWGLTGAEFLMGIPGTMGGAVRMNAGCYGQETQDLLAWVEVMDAQGHVRRLSREALGFSYRKSQLSPHDIVIQVALQLAPSSPETVHARLKEIMQQRENSQPTKGRTGGSTFKNPSEVKKAWPLIEAAGARGWSKGGAKISTKHCNFMMNENGATAQELFDLGVAVQNRVYQTSGVFLEWELIRLGHFERPDLSLFDFQKSSSSSPSPLLQEKVS